MFCRGRTRNVSSLKQPNKQTEKKQRKELSKETNKSCFAGVTLEK